MKGIVFTEFLEMVETKFGYEMVDGILTTHELPSGGVYSSVGTYNHGEMFTLVINLHKKTNIPIADLLEVFGEYLFKTLFATYGSMFKGLDSAFEMLSSIEGYIHVEVRKLYPDAELPTFNTIYKDDKKLIMDYTSERKMGDLAVGLMRGCLSQFGEKATIEKENITPNGSTVRFTLTKI